MEQQEHALLIITDDDALVATLGGKLQEWGAAVFHFIAGQSSIPLETRIDLALIDVRQNDDEALRHFTSIKSEMPFMEAVLVNISGNISSSKAGMRAGASDELIVPFDTETLRDKVNAACERSRMRRKKKTRRSLFEVFEETMSAATFAQAGEFETALEIIRSSETTSRADSEKKRK